MDYELLQFYFRKEYCDEQLIGDEDFENFFNNLVFQLYKGFSFVCHSND